MLANYIYIYISNAKVLHINYLHIIIDPVMYDRVVSTQADLDLMTDDFPGRHLASLFSNNNLVKIETTDGSWISDFYLPKFERLDQNSRWIFFFSNASTFVNFYCNRSTYNIP